MDVSESMRQSPQRQQIVAADPQTVVALARQGLAELTQKRNTPAYIALEECITRFEQSSRAHLGSQTFATSGPGQGQQWGTSSP